MIYSVTPYQRNRAVPRGLEERGAGCNKRAKSALGTATTDGVPPEWIDVKVGAASRYTRPKMKKRESEGRRCARFTFLLDISLRAHVARKPREFSRYRGAESSARARRRKGQSVSTRGGNRRRICVTYEWRDGVLRHSMNQNLSEHDGLYALPRYRSPLLFRTSFN